MAATRRQSLFGNASGQALVGFATVAFLYFTGEVLKPLALSVLLAFALTPVSSRLERLRLPRALAVTLTLVMVLSLIGGVGYVVAQQLRALSVRLPDYKFNIETKLNTVFDSRATETSEQISDIVNQVTAKLDKPKTESGTTPPPIQNVRVLQEPSFQERLRSSIGPYLEGLGVFSFILVLVLFMLLHRENLRDRIVALFGHRHVGLTTKTMEEISGRISRFLVTVALVNSGFGLVIGIGLALMGVPFAVLWGCLAAMLRFIPYVGVAATFGMTTAFTAAHFPGWGHALGVMVLFGAVEVVLSSVLEPVIFGKTTGISALGLLIAAMFWTWLWGSLGLLLSTPLTVCLAVIGKYVPNLSFFSTLLGEEAELRPHLRFYQRIVALDREGAVEVVGDALKEQSPIAVFDEILVPALARAERDSARGKLDDEERTLLWEVTSELLDQLDESHVLDSDDASPRTGREATGDTTLRVAALPVDQGDTLVLRMLDTCLKPEGVDLEILPAGESPIKLHETLVKLEPSLILISSLPTGEMTPVRYLLRRLRAQNIGSPIVVGLWKQSQSHESHRLVDEGALYVVTSINDARDRICRTLFPDEAPQLEAAPLPA